MNIAMLLQMAAEACPERRALTSGGRHCTYAELYAGARAAAARIRASGCAFASVLDTSSPAVPIMLMGAAMAGVPYVPLNYRLANEQLSALLERIAPVYLIAEAGHEALARDGGATVTGREAFLAATLDGASEGIAEADWPADPSAVAEIGRAHV